MSDLFAQHVPLAPLTTLKAGGAAENLMFARHVDDLAAAVINVQSKGAPLTVLGAGSNVLPSDEGLPGFTVVNECRAIEICHEGKVLADCGCAFQELFLKCTQAGLSGVEFAVGIPGTLGGAIVSNAGAYRSNVSTHLTRLEIVFQAQRQWVEPSFMQFAYRDSVLRRPNPPSCALLRAEFVLPSGDRKSSFDKARDFQRQRISKQPPPASAGSFFKNVEDKEFAQSLENLPEPLKQAGVVPSGFLIESAGLRGHRIGGAMVAHRHANFILNVAGATATEIRRLADLVKARVYKAYEVTLEEEVLYLGDWSQYEPS